MIDRIIAPMSTPLVVTAEDPVRLDGLLDTSNQLQLQHDTDGLDDHGQSLNAEHESLSSSSNTIRIELRDFSHGGANWQVTASHLAGGNTISWSRSSTCAYQDFTAMTDALEIDVVATNSATPSATKIRKIWIKTKPVDGQPDR